MAWLKATHPDLVPTYAKTYKGAYAPKAVGESLTATVRRIVAETRATRPERWLPDPSRRPEVPRANRNQIDTGAPVQQTLL